MKNKKGALDILIMVFLVLTVTAIALFLFVSSDNKSNDSINGALVVNELYIEEEVFIFELTSFVEQINTMNFKDDFRKKYADSANVLSNELFNKYLPQIGDALDNEQSVFEYVNEDTFRIVLKDFEFYLEKDGVFVKHVRDIKIELNLE